MDQEEINEVAVRPASSGEVIKGMERASKLQAAVMIAKRFPRNEIDAERKIKDACTRVDFATAKDTIYAYPRGGQTVRGPGVRMAEMLARYWGNMKFGFEEIERDTQKGESVVDCFAWDLENNVEESRTVIVPHKMVANNKTKHLTDPRDVYEHIANQSKRRQRECILHLIPKNVIMTAVAICDATKRASESKQAKVPMGERIKNMVLKFSEIGVNQEMIEKRLGHGVDLIIDEELDEYTDIFKSVKDGETRRNDWFKFPGASEATDGGKAAELNKLVSEEDFGSFKG